MAQPGGRVSTYEEWRVTGSIGDKPYEHLFTSVKTEDPEKAARAYMTFVGVLSASGAKFGVRADGPHLHKRTVTVTEWTEVDA
jgi:hypothetical protein